MNDDDLARDVTDELFWDPKVDNAEVAVSADDGVVTLRGTVGGFRQKREAKRSAERVFGAKRVANELQVRLLGEFGREDAELRGDVLQALMLDSFVPSSIDAKVQAGEVTLTGRADWQFQRDEAEFVAANVPGVTEVWDDVRLARNVPGAANIEESIRKAFMRNAKLAGEALAVDARNGTVTIEGTVGSWSEHDDAIAVAWASPGVVAVNDEILVVY
jgi:osmotically-inducible protein OsmY